VQIHESSYRTPIMDTLPQKGDPSRSTPATTSEFQRGSNLQGAAASACTGAKSGEKQTKGRMQIIYCIAICEAQGEGSW
jgi:hypothetical protein